MTSHRHQGVTNITGNATERLTDLSGLQQQKHLNTSRIDGPFEFDDRLIQ